MFALLAALAFALSMCADCFAVSAASSVTLRRADWKNMLPVATVFAVVQTGLLLAGWGLGDFFAGFLGRAAPVLGCALLSYVAVSLFLSSFKDDAEALDLSGIRNILIGAVATSLDALAAGVSFSLDRDSAGDMLLKAAALLIVTFLSVAAGMKGGQKLGTRYGRAARRAGGIVLLCIGLNILAKSFL